MSEAEFDFDLFVIGGGSGGVRAARIAATHGAKVGLAEEYRMGGTCVIRGCVPKKYMVYASDYGHKLKEAEAYGWNVQTGDFDFRTFMQRMHDEVSRLSGLYHKGQTSAGVEVFEDHAALLGPNSIHLTKTGRTVTAKKILIAVGGTPWHPSAAELPGVELTIDSNQIFELTELPKKMVIAGGGYIAVEFAHIFAGLGVETTLIYRGDKVLRSFDEDIRDQVQAGILAAGINLITETVIERVDKSVDAASPLLVTLSNGDALSADTVFLALGRKPMTDGLGLDKAGVELGAGGEIRVDDWSRTNVPSIWAVGDVTGRVELTPVALREGHAFADTEFGQTAWKMDHTDIATAVFVQPEVGTVGLTEAEAREAYGDVDIYKTDFRPMKNALNGSGERVFMKLIVKPADQKVIGVHLVGPEAGEMIQMLGICVKAGLTKQQFDETCAVHPTMAEEIVTMRTKWQPTAV
ncbi:MAG: glutathione-disulfide reductase [Henriciella sp.]